MVHFLVPYRMQLLFFFSAFAKKRSAGIDRHRDNQNYERQKTSISTNFERIWVALRGTDAVEAAIGRASISTSCDQRQNRRSRVRFRMRLYSTHRSQSPLLYEAGTAQGSTGRSIPSFNSSSQQQQLHPDGANTILFLNGVATARLYDSCHLKACYNAYSHHLSGMSPTQFLLLCNEAQLVFPTGENMFRLRYSGAS